MKAQEQKNNIMLETYTNNNTRNTYLSASDLLHYKKP